MATKSLYLRYRPRRFAEIKGQDHVVRALRTSVAEGRSGQAYLFSGPRGTGKTTSARILAKVLNCENPVDGEPCCGCESCLAVERGTSYDVHELDAASNNGVEAMRDLIDKASLGTPGRHKVYILDEVHMLSKAAEAALLKTLEEPPPHVVFVLATTDPQKMSDTIRSRTQHHQFRLLPSDTLLDHARWVAEDAGLAVSDDALEQALDQGSGSARDTLTALETIASGGGEATPSSSLTDVVEAMVDHDPAAALATVARAVGEGRDPRTIAEALVAEFRNSFLSLMAPDVVQLPSHRLDDVADRARRVGPAALVRGIEVVGEALTDMRHAPDPRVLLDVAVLRLTSDRAGDDVGALARRLDRVEATLGAAGSAPSAAVAPTTGSPATDADSAVGPGTSAGSGGAPPTAAASGSGPAGRARIGAHAAAAAPSPSSASDPEPTSRDGGFATSGSETVAGVGTEASTGAPPAIDPTGAAPDPPDAVTPPAVTASPPVGADSWSAVLPSLRGIVKAVYSPVVFVSGAAGRITLSAPTEPHRAKCEEHRAAVESALAAHVGTPVTVALAVGGDSPTPASGSPAVASAEHSDMPVATAAAAPTASAVGPSSPPGSDPVSPSAHAAHGVDRASTDRTAPPAGSAATALAPRAAPEVSPDPVPAATAPALHVVPSSGREIAERARRDGAADGLDESDDPAGRGPARVDELPDDHEVDLDDLVDVPPDGVTTPLDRLAEAFPGSQLVDDDDLI